MKNDFLEYYGKNHISPVGQDIEDIELHYERRKKLYQQCGIPLIAFRNAEILEVGPGGGYNTLSYFKWNAKHIDLVEANDKGIEDMLQLFRERNIPRGKYDIHKCRIEEYKTEKKYDIVIAEGFLQYLRNQWEVINRLQQLIAQDGIVVITCSDDVCMFVESMKRLIGVVLTVDIPDYNQKVNYLEKFFRPQLKQLRGVSRSVREWVQDQILNPVEINGMELSLKQAIEFFEDGFEVLGSSPHMFTDYSWYKDVWYDYKEDYKRQFDKKRFSLLQADMPEVILPIEHVDQLVKAFKTAKRAAANYERTLDVEEIDTIIVEMNNMQKLIVQNFDDNFINVFGEIRAALTCLRKTEVFNIEKYPHFMPAFGRMQQYISFAKK